MGRLLFLFAIVALVYLLLRAYRRQTPGRDQTQGQDQAIVDDMVRCAQCGVHVPKSESVQAGGRNFCCAAHRDAFRH